jgi:autotransporter-associated beta strand repeat
LRTPCANHPSRSSWAFLLLSLACACPLRAADVLFVGNSFTYGYNSYNAANITDANGTGMGGVPALFKKLATEGGHSGVNVTIEAVGGQTLAWHFANKSAILNRRWDWVILQEYSTGPLVNHPSGNVSAFRATVQDIAALLRAQNPSVRILLYEAWARPDQVGSGRTLASMQAELRESNSAAAADYSLHGWAPVGDAFLQALADGVGYDPNGGAVSGAVNLWNSDRYHANAYGAYLAGLVFYNRILGGDPRQLPTGSGSAVAGLALNAVSAGKLQQVAAKFADVIVPPPPSISAQPASVAVWAGSAASFKVVAQGADLAYQWRRNGVPLSGATGATLSLAAVQAADTGRYDVVVSNSAGDDVVSAPATLTLTQAQAYTGGTLVLAPGASVVGNITNHATLTFNRSDDYTFNSTISGTGGVTNNGHILRFTAAQTYAGPTEIRSGILVLPTTLDNALAPTTVVTVASGARLDLSGRNQTFAGLNGDGTIYSFTSTTSALTLDIAGGAAHSFYGNLGGDDPSFGLIKTGGGNQFLYGANTYTGPTTIHSGTLWLGQGGSLSPASAITASGTLAINRYGGTITQGEDFGTISGTGELGLYGDGTFVLTSDNSFSGRTFIYSNGTLQLGNGGATGSVAGDISNYGGTVVFNRNGDRTFNGVISGNGGITNAGNILRFSAAQTYTGPTRIDSGVLVLPTTADNALSSSTVVTVAAGAKLDLSGRNQTLAGLAGGGSVYSFNSTASTLTLAVGAGQAHTFSGNLGSTDPHFGLIKSGAGTQILSGVNSYTGETTVSGGTLKVTGNISSSSLTTVSGTGVLTGTGTVGALRLANGGTLAPGASPGTLNAGDTTWDVGGNYAWEINNADDSATPGTTWDFLNITGTLTFSATEENPFTLSLLTLTAGNDSGPLANFNAGQSVGYTIATASGGIYGFNANAISLDLSGFANNLAGGVWSIVQSGNNLDLIFTSPFPSRAPTRPSSARSRSPPPATAAAAPENQ